MSDNGPIPITWKSPAMPAENTISCTALAQLAGFTTDELIKVIRIKPDADGKFPANVAIKIVLEVMREEIDFISRDELAALQEITGPRVSQQVAQGILKQDAHGRWNRRETMHALIRYYRERIGEGKTTQGTAKTEALRIQNELLQIQLNKAKGDSIDRHEVDQGWANLVLLARQKFLRLGNKIAPRIPYLKSESEIEIEIQKEVDEALAELARPVEYNPEEGK